MLMGAGCWWMGGCLLICSEGRGREGGGGGAGRSLKMNRKWDICRKCGFG